MNNVLSLNSGNWEKIKNFAVQYKYIDSLDNSDDPFDESKGKLSGIIFRIYHAFLACFGSEKGQLSCAKVTLKALWVKSSDFKDVYLEESIENAKSMSELDKLVEHTIKFISYKKATENLSDLIAQTKAEKEKTEKLNKEREKLINNVNKIAKSDENDLSNEEMKKEIEDLKDKLENARDIIAVNKTKIEELLTSEANLNREKDELTKKLTDLTNNPNESGNTLVSQNEKEELNKKIIDLTNNSKELGKVIVNQNEKLEKNKKQLNEARAEIQRLKSIEEEYLKIKNPAQESNKN